MILFKLWIFDINFISILVIIIGLFFGAFLISLIFALIAVRSISDKKTIIKKTFFSNHPELLNNS